MSEEFKIDKALVESVQKAAETVERLDKEFTKANAAAVQLRQEFADETTRLRADVETFKANLNTNYGPSGAQDYCAEFSKFVHAAYWHKRSGGRMTPKGTFFGKTMDELSVTEKAAQDFITSPTAEYAGYLVPTQVIPGITEMKDVYGTIYPLIGNKVTCPPGSKIAINRDSVLPTAAYRTTVSSRTQAQPITEEATGMQWGQDSLVTSWIGSYIIIANELLAQPSVNFGAVAAARLARAVLRKMEEGVLQGDDAAGAPAPNDGILVATGPGTRTAISSFTMAGFLTFLKEHAAFVPPGLNPAETCVIVHPRDLLNLATLSYATPLLGLLAWGDIVKGIPPTILGRRIVAHPSALYSAAYYGIAGDMGMVTLAETGGFTIDFNPYGAGWTSNETYLRVFTHAAWSIGIPTYWSKTAIT